MNTPSSGITLRSVGAVLLGYILLVGIILGSFTVLTKTMSADQLFEPGTFVPNDFIIGFSLIVSVIAAVVAGFTCASIAGSRRPTYAFAAVVGTLGLITILFTLTAARPESKPRTGDESAEVVMEQTAMHKPAWLRIAEPLLGITGILLGGRLKRNSTRL